MSVIGLAIALVFIFCCASAAAGLVVPERRIPLLLAWGGSLAALAALGASAVTLSSGAQFNSRLWTIPSIARLSVSLDRLSAFFLLIAAIVILASCVFSAGCLANSLNQNQGGRRLPVSCQSKRRNREHLDEVTEQRDRPKLLGLFA